MAADYDISTGLRALKSTSLVLDIGPGFLALAQDVAKRLPTLVTSLPGAPYDGQEVYLVANAATRVLWHLRYNSALVSTYKWEFVGGPPLNVASTGSAAATGSFADAGGSMTLPAVTGSFDVSWGGLLTPAGGGTIELGPKFGTVAMSSADTLSGAASASAARSAVTTITESAAVVKLQQRVTGGTGSTAGRWLRVLPLQLA